MQQSVYLCGPITGLSYEDAKNGWRRTFACLLHDSIDVLSPMRQEGHLAEFNIIPDAQFGPDGGKGGTSEHDAKRIVAKDRLDVRRCSLVVANFLGATDKSIGSLIELGWANAWQKPIVVIMEPTGNCHDHGFIRTIADFRCVTVAEAAEITNGLLLPGY